MRAAITQNETRTRSRMLLLRCNELRCIKWHDPKHYWLDISYFTCSISSELYINWAILREIVYNSEDIDPSKRDESFLFKIPDLDLRKGEKKWGKRESKHGRCHTWKESEDLSVKRTPCWAWGPAFCSFQRASCEHWSRVEKDVILIWFIHNAAADIR